MIPVGHYQRLKSAPVVTWTLIFLNVAIYLWDRQGALTGSSIVFADLVMRPREIIDSWIGGGDPAYLVTLFTSLFLHGSLLHLAGNLLFLFVFGPPVESALGAWRFSIYYFFWGLVAWAAQIFVDPTSVVATIGASGAIGGVLGCYLILFPSSKIELLIPFVFIDLSAWVALGLWFLYQVFAPQPGVANWAHVGGFLAGMLTVLIVGGRSRILQARPDLEAEFS